MQFVNFNGENIEKELVQPFLSNRAFYYGDGFFETIKIMNGKMFLQEKHFARINKAMKVLKLQFKKEQNFQTLEAEINKVLIANNIHQGGRLRVTFFRDGSGFYAPEINEMSFFIEVTETHNGFELNRKGLNVEVYSEIKKSQNILSGFKSINSAVYVMAGIFQKERGLDDALILNDESNLIESTKSNLFIVADGKFYTPSLDQGCISGVMREFILEKSNQFGIKVYECILSVDDLINASEIFFTNAVNGIVWVGGFRNKRFYNNHTKELMKKLQLESKKN